MRKDDLFYYRRRADQELKAAAAAETSIAADAHTELAEHYSMLAAGAVASQASVEAVTPE